jgi:hypothetical protein
VAEFGTGQPLTSSRTEDRVISAVLLEKEADCCATETAALTHRLDHAESRRTDAGRTDAAAAGLKCRAVLTAAGRTGTPSSMEFDPVAFDEDGYSIFQVLSPAEAAHYAAVADALNGAPQPQLGTARNSTGGADALQCPELAALALHPTLLTAAAQALSCSPSDMLLDNLKLYYAEPGETYHQGFHRDTLHGDAHRQWLGRTFDELIQAIESDRWEHNNVQGHLAFTDDHGFRAVPGSHRRAFTAEEVEAFGGEAAMKNLHHQAPLDARISAACEIVVPAGCAIWYNNNMIHSGWCDRFPNPRRALLLGMHSGARPPTWHFRAGLSKRFDDLSPAVRDALPRSLRDNVARRNARMEELGGFGDDPAATISGNIRTFWTAGLRRDGERGSRL